MKIMLLRHYIKRGHLVPEVLPDGLPLLLLLLVLHPPLPVGDHDGLLPTMAAVTIRSITLSIRSSPEPLLLLELLPCQPGLLGLLLRPRHTLNIKIEDMRRVIFSSLSEAILCKHWFLKS